MKKRLLIFSTLRRKKLLDVWAIAFIAIVMAYTSTYAQVIPNQSLQSTSQRTYTKIRGGQIGTPDETWFCRTPNVSHIQVWRKYAKGKKKRFVIVDQQGTITSIEEFSPIRVDILGPGNYKLYSLSYNWISGLEKGKSFRSLRGKFSKSNAIKIMVFDPKAGEISGGPFEFTVDGEPDFVSGIMQSGDRQGSLASWVVTDDQGNILGLPPTLESLEGVNFDEAGPGTCLIWYLRFEEGLKGAEVGKNANDLKGCFDLSNPITVVRNPRPEPEAGEIAGGPFEFCVDGEADMVSGITQSGDRTGTNASWVVTDDQGNILGLPPTLEALEGVNFDEAGPGTCLIWYLRFEDGLVGAEVGANANDLQGSFDLSNPLTVERNQPMAGEIVGGPFEFTVDGEPDFVSGLSLEGTRKGSNSSWVVTDDQGNILGLPPTLEALEGVNFDEAGPGTCLIWYLRFEDGLVGAEVGANANNLEGCFDLSNPITVVRNESTPTANPMISLTGGIVDIDICIDDTPDVFNIELSEPFTLPNVTYLVLDGDNDRVVIDKASSFDANLFSPGECRIIAFAYEGDVNIRELLGVPLEEFKAQFEKFEVSKNTITFRRNGRDGGTLTGGPYEFTVGDDVEDRVTDLVLEGNSGEFSTYVVTDDQGVILGLPANIADVDFDTAGPGTCLIWNLSYNGDITGLEVGNNANDLVGCLELSNPITVIRNPATPTVDAGGLVGGVFNFCVDGTPDFVSGIRQTGTRSGTNATWVITDDQGKILGLPPTLADVEQVNFDEAGRGRCLIWYLRFEDGLVGAEVGKNANDLQGNFDLSNPVTVDRRAPVGGEIVGGPFIFNIDGTPDYVSNITQRGVRRGSAFTWVVTDDAGTILGLPKTLADLEQVNFDEAGEGTCLIWYLRFENGLKGAEVGKNANDLDGCFGLSNPIQVIRKANTPSGNPEISLPGGVKDITICVNDEPVMFDIQLSEEFTLPNVMFLVVDGAEDNVVKITPNNFDANRFDVPGKCGIFAFAFEDGIDPKQFKDLPLQEFLSKFDTFELSKNRIIFNRLVSKGGELKGGPYEFTVGDGIADTVSDLTLVSARGRNTQWVITDESGMILGLPAAIEDVDFDTTGTGVCLIWNLTYNNGLDGLAVGNSANELSGCYDLSNPVQVTRNAAGSKRGAEANMTATLSPNPTVDRVQIHLDNAALSSEVLITIIDASGTAISLPSAIEDEHTVTLNAAQLPSGMYFIRMIDKLTGRNVSKTFVKK